MKSSDGLFSRREVLQLGTMAGAAALFGNSGTARSADASLTSITRAVPSTVVKLPVVGLGTNNYSVTGADAYIVLRDGKEITGPLRIEGSEKNWTDRGQR